MLGFSFYAVYDKGKLNRISFVDAGLSRIYFTYKKLFEKKNVECIDKLLPVDGVVLDIGAGFGFYSIVFARNPRTTKVYAFEPNSVNFLRCKRIVEKSRLNDRVELNLLAISNETDIKRLYLDRANPANHSIKNSRNDEEPFEEVPTITIDEYCLQKGILPNFIKLDVQGHELSCLIGARETLKRCDNLVLLIELDFVNNYASVIEVVQYLNQLGYLPFLYNSKTSLEVFLPDFFSGDYIDVIFLKSEDSNHV